jgi:hypothetical protein
LVRRGRANKGICRLKIKDNAIGFTLKACISDPVITRRPQYLYEADLLRSLNANKVGEIVVAGEGQVTEGPKWIV